MAFDGGSDWQTIHCCSLEWPGEHSINSELYISAYRLQTRYPLMVENLNMNKQQTSSRQIPSTHCGNAVAINGI